MKSVAGPSVWFWSDFFENRLKLKDFRVCDVAYENNILYSWSHDPRDPRGGSNRVVGAGSLGRGGIRNLDRKLGPGSETCQKIGSGTWMTGSETWFKINGYPWMSMDIHGYPWISMDIHGTWNLFCMNGHFRRDPDLISRLPDTTIHFLSVFIGFEC